MYFEKRTDHETKKYYDWSLTTLLLSWRRQNFLRQFEGNKSNKCRDCPIINFVVGWICNCSVTYKSYKSKVRFLGGCKSLISPWNSFYPFSWAVNLSTNIFRTLSLAVIMTQVEHLHKNVEMELPKSQVGVVQDKLWRMHQVKVWSWPSKDKTITFIIRIARDKVERGLYRNL